MYKFWNDLFPFRLSSIDMKYHIWKLGVVFTDNVSMASGEADVCAPRPGKSLDGTRKPAMEEAQEDPGIVCWRQRAVGCRGDSFVLCNSLGKLGFHLAVLGPVDSTSAPRYPLSSLCPQRWGGKKKKCHDCLKSCSISSLSPVLSLPCLVHNHVSPGPLQQLLLRCSSAGYCNGLQDPEDYSVICHSQRQTGIGFILVPDGMDLDRDRKKDNR